MYPQLEELHLKISADSAQFVQSSTKGTYYAPLRPFDLAVDWDLDSTPLALKKLGRGVGRLTPAVEASMVLASLAHDIRYFYGGTAAMKQRADQLFRDAVVEHGIFVRGGPKVADTADFAKAVVDIFGGWPFLMSYSWGFGQSSSLRGYDRVPTPLQQSLIDQVVSAAMTIVLNGAYQLNGMQKARITPEVNVALEELRLFVRGARWMF